MDRKPTTLAVGTVLALVLVSLLAASVPLSDSLPADSPPPDNGNSQEPQRPNDRNSTVSLPGLSGLLRWLFLGILLAVVGGAAVVIRRLQTGGATTEPPGDPQPEPEPDRSDDADVGAARAEAVRAADRIERGDTALANEVHRAWHGMTRALGARDPRSETPQRFAERAVGAGMDEATVWELTELFREVRYGDRKPAEADEERAVELLRQLSAASNSERDES